MLRCCGRHRLNLQPTGEANDYRTCIRDLFTGKPSRAEVLQNLTHLLLHSLGRTSSIESVTVVSDLTVH